MNKRQSHSAARALSAVSLAFGAVILASTAAPAFASPTVSGTGAGTLLVPASISPIDTPAGSGPFDVVVSPNSATVYAADSSGNKVLAVNASTGATTPVSLVGTDPESIAISPNGGTVYVADYTTGIVELVTTATDTLVSGHVTLGVSSSPVAIAISPDGSRVYVVEQGTDLVEAYSTTAPYPYVGAATLGPAPTGVAISPDGKTAYVSGGGGGGEGYVDVIDTTGFNTSTDVTPTVIPIPPAASPFAGPAAIAISKDGATVYVTNNTSSTLVAIPTATDVAGTPVPAGGAPDGVAVSPDSKVVYVSDLTGAVTALSAADLSSIGTYGALDNPEAVAVSPDGNRVYTANDDATPNLRAFNVAKLTVSGPAQIVPGTATTAFAVSIADGNTTVGDYSSDTLVVDVLNSADAVVGTVPATLDPATGTVTATVSTAGLPVGTYSIRATLKDPATGGIVVATATGFRVGVLAATGVDAALPLTIGGALLLGGTIALILSRRRARGATNTAR